MTSTSSLSYIKSILVTRRYLYVPVTNSNPKITFSILRSGELVREFNVELTLSGPPDWWAFYDISTFSGKTLDIYVSEGELPLDSIEWVQNALRIGDELPEIVDIYKEQYRPQFHFTSMRGWNNDPNGLVYYAGEWHMYYQHNPFGVGWGNMHWGHAISRDLMHWKELPEALYQRSLRDMAFSGSGFIDYANDSGFQEGENPPLVVAFTSTGRGECLAYSNDKGRTLIEWEGNPYLVHYGRDPKILWIEQEKKWIMIIYEELVPFEELQDHQRGYAFYSSIDLKNWKRLSFLPGYFECPELFQLPVDNDPKNNRWVIHGCLWEKAPSTCLIGDFNMQVFTSTEVNLVSHYGPHFYASQIFSNSPDNRIIMVGWLSGADYPGMPFSQGMTVPLELSLRSTSSGTRLCYMPVKELDLLRIETVIQENLMEDEVNKLFSTCDSELMDVLIKTSIKTGLTLDIRGYPISYDPVTHQVQFAGKTAELPASESSLILRVLIDRSVTEVFINNGLAAFSSMTIFSTPSRPISLSYSDVISKVDIHKLRSIWK